MTAVISAIMLPPYFILPLLSADADAFAAAYAMLLDICHKTLRHYLRYCCYIIALIFAMIHAYFMLRL